VPALFFPEFYVGARHAVPLRRQISVGLDFLVLFDQVEDPALTGKKDINNHFLVIQKACSATKFAG